MGIFTSWQLEWDGDLIYNDDTTDEQLWQRYARKVRALIQVIDCVSSPQFLQAREEEFLEHQLATMQEFNILANLVKGDLRKICKLCCGGVGSDSSFKAYGKLLCSSVLNWPRTTCV